MQDNIKGHLIYKHNCVSSNLCWGCNTMLCYSGLCHGTQPVITEAALREPFCDKALNAVMKWETGKYLTLVLR